MTPKLPTFADLRKIADELETKMHLAGAAVRDRWNQQVKPKLAELDKKIEAQGQRAGEVIQEKSQRAAEVISQQVAALGSALEQLRHDLSEDLKIGKKRSDP